jgi:hypothetical protein
VPFCTFTTPSFEMLRFCPGGCFFVDESDDAAGDELDGEPESDGFADATHGVAANPAPMPKATASPPTRPIYLAYPIIVVPVLAAPLLAAEALNTEHAPNSKAQVRNRPSRPNASGLAARV